MTVKELINYLEQCPLNAWVDYEYIQLYDKDPYKFWDKYHDKIFSMSKKALNSTPKVIANITENGLFLTNKGVKYDS